MKYRQRGYQEEDRPAEKPRQERPRRDPELPGGRLADPQRAVKYLRCHQCGRSLPVDFDARGDVLPIPHAATCPQCEAAMHACRNCTHFDPSARFECRRPVKVRYRKDIGNDCELFEAKLVVELTRDEGRTGAPIGGDGAVRPSAGPRDARKAFEELFK